MNDNDFAELLGLYLDPPGIPNPGMVGVKFEWVRGNPDFGALHMEEKHHVTEQEVEEVLLESPPLVEAKRHPDFPERTLFWGATRLDRWLFVACEDWTEGGVRHLKPITAFEPTDGEAYWKKP